jgi:hypothetical protein
MWRKTWLKVIGLQIVLLCFSFAEPTWRQTRHGPATVLLAFLRNDE